MSTNIAVPTITEAGLVVPVPLAIAMMQFASKDRFRVNMTGLGFDDCALAATDGVSGARVCGVDPNGSVPPSYNGSAWSGEYVNARIKAAKADKSDSVLLEWGLRLDMRFPPLSRVIPSGVKIESTGPVCFNPRLVARLESLAETVQGKRKAIGLEVHLRRVPSNTYDPFVYFIPGKRPAPDIEVVVMPQRPFLAE